MHLSVVADLQRGAGCRSVGLWLGGGLCPRGGRRDSESSKPKRLKRWCYCMSSYRGGSSVVGARRIKDC